MTKEIKEIDEISKGNDIKIKNINIFYIIFERFILYV